MKNLVLALALVFTLSVLMSTQYAYAAHTGDPHLTGNCNTSLSLVYGAAPAQNNPLLRDTEIYIGDSLGRLHKIEQSDGSSCLIGMVTYTDLAGTMQTAKCTDMALDSTNQKLHCIDDSPNKNPEQSQCFEIDRTSAVATAQGSITLGGANRNNLNAMEIDNFGAAWVASDTGLLYNLDVTNCNLSNQKSLFTTGADATNPVRSSGDLVFDIVTNNDLYMTSFDCDGCALSCVDLLNNNVKCNGLYKWNIPSMTLSFISDTGFLNVFAADYVKGTDNICFVTEFKELFMLDRVNGVQQGSTLTTTVAAFGGTALVFVAGAEFLIDKTALLLAAMETNTNWIVPVVFASLGLAAFIFARKF